MSLILNDGTRNVINSMNNMKSGFAPKRSRNFGKENESMNYHFTKRYLDKLGDE